MLLSELLEDFDWREVFKYAREPGGVAGFTGSTHECALADVAEVIAVSNGENDRLDWVGLFRMTDGRFLALRAGCDYTGWG